MKVDSREVRTGYSALEGTGFEPSVPRERSLLVPRSEHARRKPPRGGAGYRLQRAKVSAFSNVSNGTERKPPIFADQPFWRVRVPPSGRVSRWPQPAFFAQYSQVRQVSTE